MVFLCVPLGIDAVGDKAFQRADGYRAVQQASIALSLARMVADPPHRRGEGIVLLDYLQGFFVALFADQRNITLGAGVGRASCLAGARTFFGDDVRTGDGLRVGFVGRGSRGKALVELTRHGDGTDLDAVVAGSALFEIDVPRATADGGPKVPWLTLETQQIGCGQDLDVPVPPGLDQLGRQDAHGAVIGGEGLVQLGHFAANRRGTLNQIDLDIRIGQVQSRLDARNPAAHYQCSAYRICRVSCCALCLFRHRCSLVGTRLSVSQRCRASTPVQSSGCG